MHVDLEFILLITELYINGLYTRLFRRSVFIYAYLHKEVIIDMQIIKMVNGKLESTPLTKQQILDLALGKNKKDK